MNARTKITLLAIALLAIALLAIALLALLTNVQIFEDGSWAIGQFPYSVGGCLPWGICN